MPSAEYTVDTACEPARLTPVFGKIWPTTLPQIGAVSVTFDAGYGAADAVPVAQVVRQPHGRRHHQPQGLQDGVERDRRVVEGFETRLVQVRLGLDGRSQHSAGR